MQIDLTQSMMLAQRLFLWAAGEVIGAKEPSWILLDFYLRPKSLPFKTAEDGVIEVRTFETRGAFTHYDEDKGLLVVSVTVEMTIRRDRPGMWLDSSGGIRVILTSPPLDQRLLFRVSNGSISKA